MVDGVSWYLARQIFDPIAIKNRVYDMLAKKPDAAEELGEAKPSTQKVQQASEKPDQTKPSAQKVQPAIEGVDKLVEKFKKYFPKMYLKSALGMVGSYAAGYGSDLVDKALAKDVNLYPNTSDVEKLTNQAQYEKSLSGLISFSLWNYHTITPEWKAPEDQEIRKAIVDGATG